MFPPKNPDFGFPHYCRYKSLKFFVYSIPVESRLCFAEIPLHQLPSLPLIQYLLHSRVKYALSQDSS